MKVNVNWLKRNLPFVVPVTTVAGLKDRSSVTLRVVATAEFVAAQTVKESTRYDLTAPLGSPNFPGPGISSVAPGVATVPPENDLSLNFPIERGLFTSVLEHKANRGFALLTVAIHPDDMAQHRASFQPEFKNFLQIQENGG